MVFLCFSLFYVQEIIAPNAFCSVSVFYRAMKAIHSHPSLQKSNHEQIALVALYKRVTMSDSLLSFLSKEQPERWAHDRIATLLTKKD